MADKAAPSKQEPSLPAIPAVWPGAFGIYKYSKQAVRWNLVTLVTFYLTIYLVALAVAVVLFPHNRDGRSFVFDLAGALSTGGLIFIWLAGIQQRTVSFGEAMTTAFNYFLKLFVVGFLTVIAAAVSLLLLVVPFFFVYPRLVLAPYLVVDKNQGIVESLRNSWDLTKGHITKVWSIILATLAMSLLVITVIGIPFAIYFLIMYSAATAVLYGYATRHKSASSAAAPRPAVAA